MFDLGKPGSRPATAGSMGSFAGLGQSTGGKDKDDVTHDAKTTGTSLAAPADDLQAKRDRQLAGLARMSGAATDWMGKVAVDRRDSAAADAYMQLRMQQLAQNSDAMTAQGRQIQMDKDMKAKAEQQRLEQEDKDREAKPAKEKTEDEKKKEMIAARLARLSGGK